MPSFAELQRCVARDLPAPDATWEARRRAAEQMRLLVEQLAQSTADAETYAALAEQLAALSARLAAHPDKPGLTANASGGGIERFVAMSHELSPLSGASSPLSPPLEMWRDDQRAWGRVRFGWAYEGPPGHVHGGFLAAVLDEFLGFAQCLGGSAGVTGKLEMRYVRPTPLHTELRLEGRLRERVGRLTYVDAKLYVGDEVTAKGKCMFVDIDAGYLTR